MTDGSQWTQPTPPGTQSAPVWGPPPGSPPVGTLPPPPWPAPRSSGSGAGAVVAAVLVGIWCVAVATLSQYGSWLVDQVLLATTGSMPTVGWLPIGLVALLLAGGPALMLALIPRSPAVRATGRVFLLGSLALGAGSMLRVIPWSAQDSYLLVLAVLCLLAALLIRRGRRGREDGTRLKNGTGLENDAVRPGDTSAAAAWPGLTTADGSRSGGAAVGWSVVGGLLVLAPFLWTGALGGPFETVAAALAALGVGLLAAAILDDGFWAHFRTGGRGRLVSLGGLVAGGVLTLLAAGVGGNGVQLLELLVLPPLGFALAALCLDPIGPARERARADQPGTQPSQPGTPNQPGTAGTPDARPGRAGRGSLLRSPATWLVALAAFGPLAFVDPEEVNLFLLDRDVPYWAMVAAGIGWAIALLVGLGYLIGLLKTRWSDPAEVAVPAQQRRKLTSRTGRRTVAIGVACAVAIGAGALHTVAGQPGFHGEYLFVVLKDQASLAGVPRTTGLGAGRHARVDAVYRQLVEHADRTQADLRSTLDGVRLNYQPYYLVNAVLVHSADPATRLWLQSRSDVDRVLTDQRLRPLPEPVPTTKGEITAPPATPSWNLTMVGAPEAWTAGAEGTGIVVGSSDSGVDGAHPALAPGYRGDDDSWFDPWNGSSTPTDHNGHGTHTLATAVGGQNVGVAPKSRWIGCVNLDRNMGSPSFYLDCMQFMLAPFAHGGDPFTDGRPARAPHVLTNSWGCPPLEGCDLTVTRPATAAFDAAGIAFVAAAGNTGPTCGSIDTPPATDPSAITVAAVDESRTVADFSSRGIVNGAKPDVAAPGVAVLSALPGGTYGELDGTSMATPHVAGVIALLWSARPELVGDLDATRQLLAGSARPALLGTDLMHGCDTAKALVGAGIVHTPTALALAAD